MSDAGQILTDEAGRAGDDDFAFIDIKFQLSEFGLAKDRRRYVAHDEHYRPPERRRIDDRARLVGGRNDVAATVSGFAQSGPLGRRRRHRRIDESGLDQYRASAVGRQPVGDAFDQHARPALEAP